jgi:hypothetical protein
LPHIYRGGEGAIAPSAATRAAAAPEPSDPANVNRPGQRKQRNGTWRTLYKTVGWVNAMNPSQRSHALEYGQRART